jgi:predicted nucleic acid-binding protein
MGSPTVERIVNSPASSNVLSWLTVLETQSAFALKVRAGEISTDDFNLLRKRLKTDIAQRRLLVTRVLRRHFDRAERLLVRYGPKQRLRSLDALHLGIAIDLRDLGHIDTLITADKLLEDVGRQEGLTILNPLAP